MGVVHTCDREKHFLFRVAKRLWHVFLLSGMEKASSVGGGGGWGDPEAKSFFFLQGAFLFFLWLYFPILALVTWFAPYGYFFATGVGFCVFLVVFQVRVLL